MSGTKTLVDIDDALLAEAQALIGARTKKETVNAALRELIALHARKREIEWLRAGGAAALTAESDREAAWR